LGNFLRNSERDERTETGSGEDGLKGSGNFTLDGVLDRGSQLDLGVVSNDVLFILVQQVVEDLLVEDGDSFEVVS